MFVKLQMQGVSINSLIGDPLAGCRVILQETANGTTMLRALLLRMRIYYSEQVATAIGDQVMLEAKEININRWEYVINECLYELRLTDHAFSEAYEEIVLNNWIKSLLTRHEMDLVLEWILVIKRNRKERKR